MKKKWLIKTLALGVVVLFIGIIFQPVIAKDTVLVEKKSSMHTFDGNILYVGGSGPGNYTSIQDAINDAVDGDTVFVYNDSSPYYENIWINKSINLLGENKNTVIIKSIGTIIKVNASKVVINGFTIGDNGVNSLTGIVISLNSSDNTISNNIIKENSYGIFLYGSNNTIYGNIIISNSEGISFGILHDIPSINNIIYRNEIANNSGYSISLAGSYSNHIYENNFKRSVSIHQHIWWYNHLIYYMIYPSKRNQWNNNYWDRPRLGPKLIPGSLVWGWDYLILTIPWFQFDRHPAKEPYDIGMLWEIVDN